MQIFVFDNGFPSVHFETSGQVIVCNAGCVRFTGYTEKPTAANAKKLIGLATAIRAKSDYQPYIKIDYAKAVKENG